MPAPDTSGLQAVAGVFGKIAQAEQDKANTAAQMEIENQLAGLENSTLYDADSGFLNRQGKDAIGVQEQFTPTWERSEEHTSELQSLMRISYAVFCLKKKNTPCNTDEQ